VLQMVQAVGMDVVAHVNARAQREKHLDDAFRRFGIEHSINNRAAVRLRRLYLDDARRLRPIELRKLFAREFDLQVHHVGAPLSQEVANQIYRVDHPGLPIDEPLTNSQQEAARKRARRLQHRDRVLTRGRGAPLYEHAKLAQRWALQIRDVAACTGARSLLPYQKMGAEMKGTAVELLLAALNAAAFATDAPKATALAQILRVPDTPDGFPD
jgi:hypothetical protein